MIHFPGQRKGEEVVAVVHKHPIVYTKIAVGFILFVAFPLSLSAFLWFHFFPAERFPSYGLIAGLAFCFYLLFGLLLTYVRITDEEFDCFIVTQERLIDITQVSFFHKSVSSAPLEMVQDVTGSIKGFFPTLLHYGDLSVKTSSAENSTFFIDHVAKPEVVARQILDWVRQKKESTAA